MTLNFAKRVRDMVHVQRNAVLVIDDDEINLSVARLILEKTLKCKVLTAESAMEGLNLMRSQHVSVVLLDIEMPGMNGFEALQEIRSDERLRNLPVIMLTSVADRETIAHVMKQGVEGYIKKPFLPKNLTEKVSKFLRLGEKGITVLVAEDDDMIRAAVGNWITDALPYHVIKAKSGAEVLEQLKSHPIQILLLDAGLPGIDGFQILDIMGMSDRLKNVRVILMTETGAEEKLAGEETTGLLAACIRKPLEKRGLLELLAEIARECTVSGNPVKYSAGGGASSNINFCI